MTAKSTYNGKVIYWSKNKERWQYEGNNRPVVKEDDSEHKRPIWKKVTDYFNLNLRM